MDFDFANLPLMDRYKLMVSTIVPRPIGLVTSISEDGIVNMAPYSFFNGMAADPPLVVLGMLTTKAAPNKDTAANIAATGEFTVNLVTEEMAEAMNITAITFPPEVDEYEESGLTPVPCDVIAPPRAKESPVAFECREYKTLEVSPGNRIIIGEVVAMHVDDDMIDADNLYVDTPALKLIGRMHGGGMYARTSDLFDLPRIPLPDWEESKKTKGAAE